MKKYAWLASISMLWASGCLEEFELPQDSSVGGSDADTAAPPCGAAEQPCCEPPLRACDERLRCDEVSSKCVTEEARLCTPLTAGTSSEQCHPGQTCCPSGLVGSCVTLAPGAECPRPDLVLVTTQETLALQRDDRTFDPASPDHACAFEKGCVAGPGRRRLLRFAIDVENQGSADLVLGDPDRSPGFLTAACDGRPYFPDYLNYELVDIGGVPVAGASGHMAARCRELPEGFSARFSCELWGLWRDFRETYADEDCQWIDITDVPAGDYVLRVTLNPEQTIEEPSNGNRKEFQISIPAFDDPLQACAAADTVDTTGGRPLLSTNSWATERECGWSAPGGMVSASCAPGETVTLSCLGCSDQNLTVQPMLRVCEGATPCSDPAALASGSGTARLQCDSELSEEISDRECVTRLGQSESFSCGCAYVSSCPMARFVCPSSGLYLPLVAAAYEWDLPFDCTPSPLLPTMEDNGDL